MKSNAQRKRIGSKRRVARGMRKPYRSYRSRVARNRVNDYAGTSESIIFTAAQGAAGTPTNTFSSVAKNTTAGTFHNTDIQLQDFTRAPIIASQYQYFRIKYLELTILPDFDTFIPGGPGTQGKPTFYYMLDKGNAISPDTTNQQLKSMGAKPIALDDKSIKIRWKPGVLLATQIVTSSGTTSAQKYMVSPWLNTDAQTASGTTFEPSQVCHYGIAFFAENVGGSMTYSATLTAHFEFKKPLVTSLQN